jgi:hypothetical protein
MISAVSVVQNYFASTGEGLKNANRGGGCPSYAPGCVGAQAYGPLELRPLCDGGCAGAPRNITAFADVVRASPPPLPAARLGVGPGAGSPPAPCARES